MLKDKKRLAYFFAKPKKTIADPQGLLAKWMEYEDKGRNLLLTDKIPPKVKGCRAYHCLYGFEHPELKSYENIFNSEVPKNIPQLITVLKEDKDARKRGAAAYLLAYSKDSDLLIKTLSRSIKDPEFGVRNDVMRVLGQTLSKVKVSDFPIKNVVEALDYPDETDRNKALLILDSLVRQNEKYKNYVNANAIPALLDQLQAQQPNLHDSSYEVLKVVSGKKYGDRDYQSWEKWYQSQIKG